MMKMIWYFFISEDLYLCELLMSKLGHLNFLDMATLIEGGQLEALLSAKKHLSTIMIYS